MLGNPFTSCLAVPCRHVKRFLYLSFTKRSAVPALSVRGGGARGRSCLLAAWSGTQTASAQTAQFSYAIGMLGGGFTKSLDFSRLRETTLQM
jgi:hypothetical protein